MSNVKTRHHLLFFYLSVNLLDKNSTNEDTNDIVLYYKSVVQMQMNDNTTAYNDQKIFRYIDCAKKSNIIFNKVNGCNVFNESGQNRAAFKHRPTPHSTSHSGVEFLRTMDYLKQKRFSQSITRNQRIHEA